jgi:hypothetical protein
MGRRAGGHERNAVAERSDDQPLGAASLLLDRHMMNDVGGAVREPGGGVAGGTGHLVAA